MSIKHFYEERERMKTVTVIVPVYNEIYTIKQVLDKLKSIPEVKNIVVVDDGSTDGTHELLKDYKGIEYEHYSINRGKGYAIRVAQVFCKSIDLGDYVIIQDADLEYNPEEYAHFLEINAPVIFGNRFHPGNRIPLLSIISNMVITHTANILWGTLYNDLETCYKMIRSDIFLSLPLSQNRFGIEVELAYRLRQYDVKEVDINYIPRSREEGKKINWKDGLEAMRLIGRYGLFYR